MQFSFEHGEGCKWTEIGEKALSLVEAAVTQPKEKLLSSEMNLLNNLSLMGLSIVFCFCAYLYFSLFLFSPRLRYCVLLFCRLLFPRLFILPLPCFISLLVLQDIRKALKNLKDFRVFKCNPPGRYFFKLKVTFSCISPSSNTLFCPIYHPIRSELLEQLIYDLASVN